MDSQEDEAVGEWKSQDNFRGAGASGRSLRSKGRPGRGARRRGWRRAGGGLGVGWSLCGYMRTEGFKATGDASERSAKPELAELGESELTEGLRERSPRRR